jgi:hypothetical protein
MSLTEQLAGELRRERREQVGIDTGKLVQPRWPQLGIRFAFGAAIALGAGLVGMRWGPRVGGLFLAFPAVLPAALTLLEREEGASKTDIDAIGAILGALAMLVFAVLVASGMGVLAAGGVWIVVAVMLFYGLRVGIGRLL